MSGLGRVFQMCSLACRPILGQDSDVQRIDLCVTGFLCTQSAQKPNPEELAKQLGWTQPQRWNIPRVFMVTPKVSAGQHHLWPCLTCSPAVQGSDSSATPQHRGPTPLPALGGTRLPMQEVGSLYIKVHELAQMLNSPTGPPPRQSRT